jgi:hypothetical protein
LLQELLSVLSTSHHFLFFLFYLLFSWETRC